MSLKHLQIYLLLVVLLVIELIFLFLYIFAYKNVVKQELLMCKETKKIASLKRAKERYNVIEKILLLFVFFIFVLMMVVTTLLGIIQEVNDEQLTFYQWLRYIGVVGAASALVMVRVQFNQAKRK